MNSNISQWNYFKILVCDSSRIQLVISLRIYPEIIPVILQEILHESAKWISRDNNRNIETSSNEAPGVPSGKPWEFLKIPIEISIETFPEITVISPGVQQFLQGLFQDLLQGFLYLEISLRLQ